MRDDAYVFLARRRATVLGFLVLVAVRLMLGLLADSPATTVLEQVTFLVPLVLSASGSVVVALRTRGVERRFWGFLSVAIALTLVWESYVSAYILFVDPAGPLFPSWPQVVPLAAVAAFFVAVVSVTSFGDESFWTRFRLYLDVLAALVLGFLGVFAFAISPIFSSIASVSTGAMVAGAIYPVVGAAMLIVTPAVFLPFGPRSWRGWEKLVAIAIGTYALGLVVSPVWLFRSLVSRASAPISGGFMELALACGNYLFFAAAVYRLTSARSGWRRKARPAAIWDWIFAGYPVAMVILAPVLGAIGVGLGRSRTGNVMVVSAFVLSFVLVARSWLTVTESAYHQRRAEHDPLTGLPNELKAKADMEVGLLQARRFDDALSFAVLDIDDFSRVNDVEGHLVGDRLLMSVAEVLSREIAETARLYRLSADEFGVIMAGRTGDSARRYVARLSTAAARKAHCPGLPVSMSAGVATSLATDEEATAIIERAISALQTAKMRARGSVVLYDPEDVTVLDPEERLDRARKQSHVATVRALAAAVDARDPAGRDHSRTTARLARALAKELGIAAQHVEAIELAAVVHDVGRLALPDSLIGRHLSTTEDERARVREHVELGERILNSTEMSEIRPWVRAHHERWDGTGYPDGLSGEQIPLEARIIAVCNEYDVMTSGLSGERPLTRLAALQEIDLGLGGRFDPDIGEAFIQLVSRRSFRLT